MAKATTITFPIADSATEVGRAIRPKLSPNNLSKKSAAISSPLSLISPIGTTNKYATLISMYKLHDVTSAVKATDLKVR